MPDVSESIVPDFGRFSEALRRRLYDQVVEIQFSPGEGAPYTPDEAELQVVCFGGRWLAVWTDLEQPPAVPARQRLQIVRIERSLDDPAEIALYAV
jgi:hypothetical protein